MSEQRYQSPTTGPVVMVAIIGFLTVGSAVLMTRGSTSESRTLPPSSPASPAPPLPDPTPAQSSLKLRAGHHFYTVVPIQTCLGTGQCKEYDFCYGREPRANGTFTLVDQYVAPSGAIGVVLVCVWEKS